MDPWVSRESQRSQKEDGHIVDISFSRLDEGISDWMKDTHVHVDASLVTLGVILAQPGEGSIDHPIVFARQKLLFAESNYTTTEQEGLVMVYSM